MTDLTPLFEAARLAAQLCQQVRQEHIIRSDKAGSEPVTIADYGSQALICRAIQQYTPDYAVMAEESGVQFRELLSREQQAQVQALVGDLLRIEPSLDEIAAWLDHGKGQDHPFMWVIDPIDGTKGFISGGHYVVGIALMQDRVPIGGIIAAPEYPGGAALIYAQAGAAYKMPLAGGEAVRIHVSAQANPALMRALESEDKSHSSFDRMARVRAYAGMQRDTIERAHSMEKYGRIAAGDAELYLRLPRVESTRPHNIWDHAPGAAIVQAAGGTVTGVNGEPLDFSNGTTLKNLGVVASNGVIHNDIIAAVQRVLAEDAEQSAVSE